jgi:hypothetical protein
MIKIAGDRFTRVEHPTGVGQRLSLAEAGIREGEHLREYIARSPTVFFGELEQELLIIGTEVPLAEGRLRADILAIDRDGAVVIVELKRNADRDQHLQALGYAAHLWSSERLREGLGAAAGLLRSEGIRKELASFLRVPMEQVNRKQRILLVAEDYYLTTLRTVLFLTDEYALDITLCRIALHEYPDGRYLACERVVPEKELEQTVNSVRLPNRLPSDVQTLAGTVAAWQNPTLTAFVEAHEDAARATNKGVAFFFRANGHGVRFALDRRTECAGRVLQSQRFPADVEYWRKCLPEVELREKERKKGVGRNPLQWNLPDQGSFAAFLRGLVQLPQETSDDGGLLPVSVLESISTPRATV